VAVALVVLHRIAARANVPTASALTANVPTASALTANVPTASTPAAAPGRSPLLLAVAALAVVIAAANLVQVYRVGDSGARAVWQGTQTAPTQDR
jgi:hypothetical protein